MDDLMKHFSGLSAETSGPSSPQHSQPRATNPSTARVNLSIRQRTPKSSAAFTPPTPVTDPPTPVNNETNDTHDKATKATPTTTESRNSSIQTEVQRGSSGFTFPNSMDLEKYRELFMRESIPSVPTVYGGSESHSASRDASSADYNGDNDDDDGDYIRHFHADEEDSETVLPAPQPDLLKRLEGLNDEEAYTTELSRAMSTPSDTPDDEGSAPSYHSLKTEQALVRQPDVGNMISQRLQQLDQNDKARDELLADLRNDLHRHDLVRDELVTELRSEVQRLQEQVQGLQNALKANARELEPSSTEGRAAAAEKSLMEAQQEMASNAVRASSVRSLTEMALQHKAPFICVMIDGEAYDFHGQLIQAGQSGGVEAAERLVHQIQDYVARFNNADTWNIMIYFFMNLDGLIAGRRASNPLHTTSLLRGFISGFTLSLVAPHVHIIDVGQARDAKDNKIEAMFHLFANNVHCKRIILGCDYDSSYASALSAYDSTPLIAAKITLLASGDDDDRCELTKYDILDLGSCFKPISSLSSWYDGESSHPGDEFLQSTSAATSSSLGKASKPTDSEEDMREAAADNRNTSSLSPPRHLRHLHPPRRAVKQDKIVLLNINNERVDPAPEPEDFETRESMLDRIEVRGFCRYYHLRGKCSIESSGEKCKFRHGPDLNKEELKILENHLAKSSPCHSGSHCRNNQCVYSHVCPLQPGCPRGVHCKLYKFHEIDPTAIRVWRP